MTYGLISTNYNSDDFVLKSISTTCDIKNTLVNCKSIITYYNEGNKATEGLFTFPLEGKCIVYNFEAVFGNKTIKGICREINEAKNLYESAKEKGVHTAYVERHINMHDTFNCKIGSIPAKGTVSISLEILLELRYVYWSNSLNQKFSLELPLILRVRYQPEETLFDNYENSYIVNNNFDYSFTANILGSVKIVNVTSGAYELQVNYTDVNQTSAEVVLKSNYTGKHDLEIFIDYEGVRQPTVYYELGSEHEENVGNESNGKSAFLRPDVALLNVLPIIEDNSDAQLKFEIVFIVDRSGSMSGSNIKHAGECLLIFLKSLPLNCKFQIYGFGSNFDKVFNSPQLYGEDSINLAINYQKNIKANFGGTEILEPLKDLFSTDVASDYFRLIFLLTDGDVENQNEVVHLIRMNKCRTILNAVGIGDGASTSLVRETAEAGNGTAIFVRQSKDLRMKVINLLNSSLETKVVQSSKIEFTCSSSVKIITIPKNIDFIISNRFLSILCIIKGLKKNEKIKGKLIGVLSSGKNFTIDMEIDQSKGVFDPKYSIHRHFARCNVDEMVVKLQRMENETVKNEDTIKELKAAIVKLSIEANIVTDYTTFVAIDPEVPNFINFIQENRQEDDELYECDDSEGYDDVDQIPTLQPNSESDGYGYCDDDQVDCLAEAKPYTCSKMRIASYASDTVEEAEEIEEIKEIEKNDPVMIIAEKQNILGYWEMKMEPLKQLNADYNESMMKKIKPADKNVNDNAWATVLVIAYLISNVASEEAVWQLMVKKAKSWLEGQYTRSEIEDLICIATKMF